MSLPDRGGRVLLERSATRDVVDALAEDLDWRLLNIYPQREGRPRQRFFGAASGDAMIVAVEDHRIGATYLLVSGHDPDAICALIRSRTAHVEERALLQVLERVDAGSEPLGSGEHLRALAWLGVVAAHDDARVRGLLEQAARSDHPGARDAAGFALEALAR